VYIHVYVCVPPYVHKIKGEKMEKKLVLLGCSYRLGAQDYQAANNVRWYAGTQVRRFAST